MKIKLTIPQFIAVFAFVIALVIVGTLIALGGQAGTTGSIVQSQTIYTKPNVTDITTALQAGSIGVPHFAINTVSVITDSNGVQHNQVSSFLNLIPDTLIGPNGILLDKGSVQSQVFAVGDDNQQMIVSGIMSIYLDTRLVGQKHITGQGITMNKNLPLLLDGDPTLNFTFADEGTYNWINGSKHSYSIYLSNVQATIGSGTNSKVYSYYGQFLAYVINMQVDNTHIVEKNIYGNNVSVYKADDTVEIRDSPDQYVCPHSSYLTCIGSGSYPTVSVQSNGFILGTLQKTKGIINGIPRNQNVTITVDGTNFNVKTPMTGNQYLILCKANVYEHDINSDATEVDISGYKCTSNFGYSN